MHVNQLFVDGSFENGYNKMKNGQAARVWIYERIPLLN